MYSKTHLILGLCLLLGQAEAADTNHLVVGIFPRYNYTENIKMFYPIAEYLEANLNTRVEVKTNRYYTEFLKNVANNDFDLVHLNQYQYLIAHDKYHYKIILKNEENGKSTIRSLVVVNKQSRFMSLGDLKGKKIIFGGNKTAMLSYIVPRTMLVNAGLSHRDYTSMFALNPPNALVALSLGEADASGVGDSLLHLENIKKHVDTDNFRILAKSESIPHLVWAVSPKLSDKQSQQLKQLLLKLNTSASGRSILSRARLSGVREANHTDYEPLKKYFGDL